MSDSERVVATWRLPLASPWVRVANASLVTDAFLVSAVTTIVVTRSYLAAAGYPQVGGDGLHVSHMLWGGLLMTVALLMSVLFISRGNRLPVAVIGGIGFGLFVDEIGKYVTSDNDYFFKPTFALVYILIIGIYFILKTVMASRPLKPHEFVLNAIDFLEHGLEGRLTEEQKATGLYRLEQSKDAPLATEIADLIREIGPVAPGHRLVQKLKGWYRGVRETRQARAYLTAWFVLQVALLLGEMLAVSLFVHDAWKAGDNDAVSRFAGDSLGLSAIMVVEAATVAASLVLTAIAVRRLSRGLHPAYRAFENSLLLSIFVTQVLAFFQSWVVAIFAVAAALLRGSSSASSSTRRVTRRPKRRSRMPQVPRVHRPESHLG